MYNENRVKIEEENVKSSLSELEKIQKREMKKFLEERYFEKIIDFHLPKRSSVFTTVFTKKIFKLQNTRELVIISHLFLENVLEEIIKQNIPKPKQILNFSFYNKLKVLHSLSLLPDKLYSDILLINELRNKYAHNLKYSIADFNIRKFSYFRNFKVLDFKRKVDIENYYHFLLSLCIGWTHIFLYKYHPYIHLMDY